jgi:hypothetical protein
MTSLAKQLSSAGALIPKPSGPPPSFLYEPRQAQETDVASVFSLAVSGFVELCGLDERFAPFESTLFSPSANTPTVRPVARAARMTLQVLST